MEASIDRSTNSAQRCPSVKMNPNPRQTTFESDDPCNDVDERNRQPSLGGWAEKPDGTASPWIPLRYNKGGKNEGTRGGKGGTDNTKMLFKGQTRVSQTS